MLIAFSISPVLLFPILTSLLHPGAPEWLRLHISKTLSLLPLRPDGVISTLMFLANTALANRAEQEVSPGFAFPLEVLNHAARLLSSMPSTVATDQFFASVVPQLLDLLDGEVMDMQRAAAYIIGNGILEKRIYGAPGKPGWDSFVKPIIKALMPESPPQSACKVHDTLQSVPVVVSSDNIRRAVSRLAALLLIHPNVALGQRLVSPVYLSLWAVTCVSSDSSQVLSLRGKAEQILYTYIKACKGSSGLISLTDHLLWDGGIEWTFVLNSEKDLEIRGRVDESRPEADILETMGRVDSRVNAFVELLNTTATNEEVGFVFVHVARKWLLGSTDIDAGSTPGKHDYSSTSPIDSLIYAKLTQEILEKHKDKLVAEPDSVLKLLHELLKNFVQGANELETMQHASQKVKMASLGSIVQAADIQRNQDGLQKESAELVSVSLGLLEALVDSMSLGYHSPLLETLGSLTETLSALVRLRQIPQSIAISARTISDQISRLMSDSALHGPAAQAPSKHALDLETRATALQNLSSPLAPVRAEGLSLLTQLIAVSSPVIDVPSTTILLLSVLQDNEEYIYLAVIRTLGQLAQRHQSTVSRMIMDSYVDSKEEGRLDNRLRMGEALRTIVGELGLALKREIATSLGEGFLAVAGRRGRRPKTAEERRKRKLVSETQHTEAAKAWDGDVPKIDTDEDDDEKHDSIAQLTEILSGWEGQDEEEDVRMRVSALSVLGVLMETCITRLDATVVSTSIDLAISILKIERSAEKAILRRAATLLFMSIVKGCDNADDQRQAIGFEFTGESLRDIADVLKYLKDLEEDIIVKGHMGEVMEGLESWQIKRMIRVNDESSGDIRFNLEGQLKGINASIDVDQKEKPRIEEQD